MNVLSKALQKTVRFLNDQQVPYMVIGGLANSLYGESRQTFDIDIKIRVDQKKLPEFIKELADIGQVMTADPLSFLRETGVLPIDVEKVRVDLILAQLPYEQQAISRSRESDLLGVVTRVTMAEDLIIQKSISPRSKDWLDIEGIIGRQSSALDWGYIMENIRELAEFLSDPALVGKIEQLYEQTRRS